MDNIQRVAAAEAFRSAVDAAGSQSAFERRTGLKQQTVSNILRRGDVTPPEYVLATEREFQISRHVLRPDIYPVEAVAGPSTSIDCDPVTRSQRANHA